MIFELFLLNFHHMPFFSFKSFSKPFPFVESCKGQFLIALFFGAFTFAFLSIFEPFLVDEIVVNKYGYLLGYGLVTFSVLFCTLRLFTKLVDPAVIDGWTLGKMLLLILFEIFLISILNWVYSYFSGLYDERLESPWTYGFYTISLGCIPIAFFLIYLEKRFDRKHQKEAEQVFAGIVSRKNHQLGEMVRIGSGNQELNLVLDQLLCIKALGNYVEVFYQKDNMLKKKLLRQSLTEIADQVKDHDSLKHCHRSYIVNFNRIEKVHGNARNFNLHLPGIDFTVPVSRSFPAELIKSLKK